MERVLQKTYWLSEEVPQKVSWQDFTPVRWESYYGNWSRTSAEQSTADLPAPGCWRWSAFNARTFLVWLQTYHSTQQIRCWPSVHPSICASPMVWKEGTFKENYELLITNDNVLDVMEKRVFAEPERISEQLQNTQPLTPSIKLLLPQSRTPEVE